MNQRNIKSFGDNNEVLVGQLTEDAGVYVVTLNSPETINALSGGMVRAGDRGCLQRH